MPNDKRNDVMTAIGLGGGLLIDPSKPAPPRIATPEEQEAALDELRRVFNELKGYLGGEVQDAVNLLTKDIVWPNGQVQEMIRCPWAPKPGTVQRVTGRLNDVGVRYEAALAKYLEACPIKPVAKGKRVEREDEHGKDGDD